MNGVSVNLRNRLGNFKLDIAFDAPARGVTALFGRSGSGKTSVLRAVAGLEQGGRGRIRFNGHIWQDDNRFVPTHQRPIGYVFQEASLFPHLSVKQNLEYGWRRIPKNRRRIAFDEAVELLGISPLLGRAPSLLSGGERQRVAIARALLTSPRLLLMDEPLSALDSNAKQAILPYLERLHDELAIPSLYVSHDPNEVARLADHMILLDQGKIAAQGPAAQLLTQLDLPLARFDEATALIEGKITAHDDSYHLTWISTHGGRVAVTRKELPIGKPARVEIMARDVSLALNSHADTSIINILPVEIMAIEDISPSLALVRLQLGDGQTLLSRITRRSAMSLNLEVGQHLFAQIKSVALIS